MVRKMVIVLAAATAVIAGSTLEASARMGHGGFGHMGGFARGGFDHGAFVRSGGFGRSAAFHPGAFRGHRFAFRHHRFFRNRFVAFAAIPYAYSDSCYARVWTPAGWRWRYVCDY